MKCVLPVGQSNNEPLSCEQFMTSYGLIFKIVVISDLSEW